MKVPILCIYLLLPFKLYPQDNIVKVSVEPGILFEDNEVDALIITGVGYERKMSNSLSSSFDLGNLYIPSLNGYFDEQLSFIHLSGTIKIYPGQEVFSGFHFGGSVGFGFRTREEYFNINQSIFFSNNFGYNFSFSDKIMAEAGLKMGLAAFYFEDFNGYFVRTHLNPRVNFNIGYRF